MRTSKLRMGALAGAVIVALGGCSTTTWSDMTSRLSGGSSGTSSATQSGSSGSASSMSSSYGAASSGASTTPGSGSTTASAPTTIAQNSTSGRETDTISGSSARSYADAPSTLPKDRSSTTSSASTDTPSAPQGAEVDTLTGRSLRRGYAQNQALNAQTASGGATGTQNAASSMSANAGQSGAMSEMSKSTGSASARPNTRDATVVREVQQALNDKGFNPGRIDGKWGPRTQAALAKFQKSQGLTASRKLDDQTLAALGVDTSNMQTSQAGSGSDASNRISSSSSGQMQSQKH